MCKAPVELEREGLIKWDQALENIRISHILDVHLLGSLKDMLRSIKII